MATLTKKTSTPALIAYAREHFGLDLTGAERPEVIAALVENGVDLSGGDTTPAKVETAEQSKELDMGDVSRTLNAQRKVRIMIPPTEKDKGDVTVSPNGYTYLIKRGAVVEVPEAVKNALDTAVTQTYTMAKDGRTLEGPFEVLTYPYTFMGYVE
ncbi:MAG: hypothetical protein II007_13390 [Gammaproteobacteria bacterium]|nr:hypothetical protein [Gammaproteobacteria bacterium]